MRLIACFIMSNRQVVFFFCKKRKSTFSLEVKKIYPMRYSKKDIPEDPAYIVPGVGLFSNLNNFLFGLLIT